MADAAEQPSLLKKTAKAAGWVISWRLATRALGVISTLTLVRLLAPSDFGLVALGTAFAQSVDAFSVLGVEDVVVRAVSPGRDVYDTAFTVNALRGMVTAVLLAAASVPLAGFFGDPRLTPILLALAVAALIDGFENIGIVDYRRAFTFDKEFKLQIMPRVVGIVLTIAAAAWLHSFYALVIGIVSTRALRTVLGYVMHPFRPRFTLRAWRSMVGFSVWTWFISLAALLRDRAPSLVIARLADPVQLGFFTVAAEVAALPTSELIEPLCRACFSGFAAARHQAEGVAQTYVRVVGMTALVTLPAGFGISIVADPLVRIAFGTQWVSAIVPIQILALAGTLSVLGYVSSTLFSAHALLSHLFRLTAWVVAIRLALLVALTSQYGIVGSAVALTLATAAEQGLFLVATCRQFSLRMSELAGAVWRPALATAVMTAVLAASGAAWVQTEGSSLAVSTHLAAVSAAGAALYVLALGSLWIASGRPAGAEADVVQILGRIVMRLQARFAAPTSVRPL